MDGDVHGAGDISQAGGQDGLGGVEEWTTGDRGSAGLLGFRVWRALLSLAIGGVSRGQGEKYRG